MLSDDSLKKELDDVSIELQNKKIDINETIIDTLAMVHPFTGLIAQRKKEKLIKLQEKEVKRNRENENNDPQA
jgi:hypothetical protein